MRKLIRSKNLMIGSAFAVALAGLGVAQFALQGKAEAQSVQAPKFEVDPLWPKPMPNHWVFGMSIGVWVDNNDHIWMVHRDNTVERTILQLKNHQGSCCQPAPPVVAFDEAGNVLHAWGGKVDGAPYQWPESNHGITVDGKGNVWIGGNGGPDSQILKFTQDGKFIMQIGKSGARKKAGAAADANAEGAQAGFVAGSNDPDNFGRVAKIFIDNKANEAYVADGYLNHRVAVLDMDTGKMKRWWGAYGQNPVDDTVQPRYTADGPHDRAHEQTFRNPVHCADISVDRLVYVCDRVNDRMQVFTPEGKFVKEMYYQTDTLTDGSVWDIAFSKDPQQKYIFMADGVAEHVVIIDRQTLTPIYTFGDGGNYAGEFHGVHSIAIDSKGNLFTTETYGGRRIQKFIYKGMGPVTQGADLGPALPKS
jgi:DNA-binding beta-propeller fold protein YncE